MTRRNVLRFLPRGNTFFFSFLALEHDELVSVSLLSLLLLPLKSNWLQENFLFFPSTHGYYSHYYNSCYHLIITMIQHQSSVSSLTTYPCFFLCVGFSLYNLKLSNLIIYGNTAIFNALKPLPSRNARLAYLFIYLWEGSEEDENSGFQLDYSMNT